MKNQNKGNYQIELDLEFFRHGKKEKNSDKHNADLLLTSEGKEQAYQKGQELDANPEQAIAFGGPKLRTQETAAHVMLAKTNIDQDASLIEMKKKISQNLKIGKKIVEDQRLDFNLKGPIAPEAISAYKKSRYLKFLVYESDKLAQKRNDCFSSTYLRQAGNIAEIVDKYLRIARNFQHIYREKKLTNSQSALTNRLERYLASHKGVIESFIAKIIEEVEGIEVRDKFVEKFPAGYDNLEGIKVKIVSGNQDLKMKITYLDDPQEKTTKTIEVSENVIRKIIKERKEFEKIFTKNKCYK